MIGYYTPYLFIVKVATLERSIVYPTAVYLLSFIGTTRCFHDTRRERLFL